VKRFVRHVFVLVVLGLFCLAGFWQIHRLHERQAYNRRVRAAMALPQRYLNRTPVAAPYRRVRASGRYDDRETVLLRSQVLNDAAGDDVLTPFVLEGGKAVLVDRGWIPLGSSPPRVVSDRFGTSIEGLVLPSERKRPFSPDIPKTGHVNAVNYVNVKRIEQQLPYTLTMDNYVLLQKERPAPKSPLYEAPPELTEGPHRAYAVQWFLFMVIGIVGYSALLKREKRKSPPQAAGSPGRL
jgi:cytochrome oxidase assembly protein ShyY1